MNLDSEDADVAVVDEVSASKDETQDDGKINLQTENVDPQAKIDKLSEKQTFDLAIEVITETVVAFKKVAEEDLTKNKEIMKRPTVPLQDLPYGNGVIDEKTAKEDKIVDSLKVTESLATFNLGLEAKVDEGEDARMNIVEDPLIDVNNTTNSETGKEVKVVDSLKIPESMATVNLGQDAAVDEREDARMIIVQDPTIDVNNTTNSETGKEDKVVDSLKIPESLATVNLGQDAEVNNTTNSETGKEDKVVDSLNIPESLATVNLGQDAEVDKREDVRIDVNITTNSETSMEQKLLESSSKPVLIQHQDDHKSREPIVYGRRLDVEVPLYESLDVQQKHPEPSSPVSEDENLKIQTDSEEDDDDDNDESEQKEDRQKPELLENGNWLSLDESAYFNSPESEGKFSVSDLVWGKVRSHPWWPGQIIDPNIASKKAMKYYKEDRFLVAYFGDRSFAWNNSSVLKPFRASFSQLKNQTDTEIFKTAIDCALEEVARRVELGLTCSCAPKEIFKKIERQIIESAGVRKKLSKIHGHDESCSVSSFEPDKLVDYVRLLARSPAQINQMDLAITKAQLSSYGHYKGHRELSEFLVFGDLLEESPSYEKVEQVYENGEKFENNLVESVTVDTPESVSRTRKRNSSSGLKKRKARVSVSNGSVKRPNRQPSQVSPGSVSTPKPFFKIGEMIQRVASQLTVKSGSDTNGQHVGQVLQAPENPQSETSVAEMLSQLCLTAQDPMKEYGFFQTIIPFFYERRAVVFSKSLKKSSVTEKPESGVEDPKECKENDPEGFDFDFDFSFDDASDSYWMDKIVQNQSEHQPLQDNQNEAVEEHPVVEHQNEDHDHPKPVKRRRNGSTNKKRKRNDLKAGTGPEPEEESEVDRKRQENSATEVVLKFEEGINFCSEFQLNKMFRRFGPVMESETVVDRVGGWARVVFKKCCDAEVAHNSGGKFKIFGSVNVNYELNYTPLVSYKPLPLPVLQEDDPMDVS